MCQRANDLKREFPNKVRAVYVRRGDIFCKTEPSGEVIRITQEEKVDDIRRQLLDRPLTVEGNGAAEAE